MSKLNFDEFESPDETPVINNDVKSKIADCENVDVVKCRVRPVDGVFELGELPKDITPIHLPTSYYKELMEFAQYIKGDNVDQVFFDKWLDDIKYVWRNHIKTDPNKDDSYNKDQFTTTMEDEDSEWVGEFTAPSGKKIHSRTMYPKKVNNTVVSDKSGVARFVTALGLASVRSVPMYNSGIVMSMMTPQDIKITELHRQISDDAIALGRVTAGLVYTNYSVLLVNKVVNFIIDHVDYSSVDLKGKTTLTELLLVNDLYPMINAITSLMYPRGVPYIRKCSANPKECSHEEKGIVKIEHFSKVNYKGLTDAHMNHLCHDSPKAMLIESVLEYQRTLPSNADKTYSYTSYNGREFKITFSVPTIKKYISSGKRWINHIKKSVNDTITDNVDVETRNSRVNEMAKATIARSISHWIKSIEVETNTVEDETSIENILEYISADDDMVYNIKRNLNTFINASTVSVVGVPAYDCPMCGEDQSNNTDEDDPFINIIPIDELTFFFDLAGLTRERVLNR